MVCSVVLLAAGVDAKRRVGIEAAVGRDSDIAVPQCGTGIPAHVASGQNRAVIGPVIEVLCGELVEGEHPSIESIRTLELDCEGILGGEQIEGVTDLAAGRIRVEKITGSDELVGRSGGREEREGEQRQGGDRVGSDQSTISTARRGNAISILALFGALPVT